MAVNGKSILDRLREFVGTLDADDANPEPEDTPAATLTANEPTPPDPTSTADVAAESDPGTTDQDVADDTDPNPDDLGGEPDPTDEGGEIATLRQTVLDQGAEIETLRNMIAELGGEPENETEGTDPDLGEPAEESDVVEAFENDYAERKARLAAMNEGN